LKKRSPEDLKKKNKKHCFAWATNTQHGVLARPAWKKMKKQSPQPDRKEQPIILTDSDIDEDLAIELALEKEAAQ
jgi:hypothetical protein